MPQPRKGLTGHNIGKSPVDVTEWHLPGIFMFRKSSERGCRLFLGSFVVPATDEKADRH